jgi:predicted nucleic acid-binding protein
MNSYQKGVDFADALHLASASSCENLKSFDKKFRKKTQTLDLTPAVTEPT